MRLVSPRPLRAALGAALAMATLAVAAVDVSAQDNTESPPAETSTTSTLPPETTAPTTTAAPATTVPPSPSTAPSTTVAPPGAVPPAVDLPDEADPHAGEAPPVPLPEVPAGDFGLPRWTTSSTGGGAVIGNGPTASSVEALTAAVVAAEAAQAANQTRFDAAETALADAHTHLEELSETERRSTAELSEARAAAKQRAIEAYVRGGQPTAAAEQLSADNLADAMVATRYAASAADAANRDVSHYVRLRDQASAEATELAESLDRLTATRDSAAEDVFRSSAEVLAAQTALSVAEHPTFTFPIAGPFNFVDTFGAARSTAVGWHQGTDVFSPTGTPLVAVESGMLTKVGSNPVGGLRLWVIGDSGNQYYYAHLSGFTPTAVDGARVNVGDVIGYVGNTGNAATTPPHLHFEIRAPGVDGAVNPYPFLRALAEGRQPIEAKVVRAPVELLSTFQKAATTYGVPLALLIEQARVESAGFAADVIACTRTSSAGALGVSQFMPSTALSMGVDPCDVASAIDGQARLMRGHKDRFGSWTLALAAYNAGGTPVAACGCVPAITETRNYVAKITAAAGIPYGQ